MNTAKKIRYAKWLSRAKAMADKYEITLDQVIDIIDNPGIKDIRELLDPVESEGFIQAFLRSKYQWDQKNLR